MSPSAIQTDVATVGPQDVDAPGELAPKVTKEQHGQELIDRVRANYPLDLVILLQREEDKPRTAALDADEVLAAATKAFGDAGADGGVAEIQSARVRGKAQAIPDKALCILWLTASGRTARGALPYAQLTVSQDNFDRKIATGEITEVDEKDAKDLKRTVERQEELIKRLNAKLAEAAPPQSGDSSSASGTVEAPQGNAKDLIGAVGTYSDEQLAALVASDERSSVVKAAKAEQKRRAAS